MYQDVDLDQEIKKSKIIGIQKKMNFLFYHQNLKFFLSNLVSLRRIFEISKIKVRGV